MLFLLLVENMKYGFEVHSSSIKFIRIFTKLDRNFPKQKRGKQEESNALFSFMVIRRGKISLAEKKGFRLFPYSAEFELSLIALFGSRCTVHSTPVLHCSMSNARLHSNLNSTHVDPRDVGRRAFLLRYCSNIFT
jgi:hypothetical protein